MSNLTDVQKRAVTHRDGSLCVDAGAGSGKTTVLVERIADILAKHHADLDEIVAITFTELAARELKDRLRATFRARGNTPDIDADTMTFWRDLERRADTARISTIHGFCASILRERALHIGLDPDFAVLDETNAYLLRERVIIDEVHAMLADEDDAAIDVAAPLGMRQVVAALHEALTKPEAMRAVTEEYGSFETTAILEHVRAKYQVLADAILRDYCQSHKVIQALEQLQAFDGACSDPSDPKEMKRRAQIAVLHAMRNFTSLHDIETAIQALKAIKGNGKRPNWGEAFDAVNAPLKAGNAVFTKLPAVVWDEEIETEAASLTAAFYAMYTRVHAAYEEAKSQRNAIDFSGLIHDAADAIHEGGLSTPIRFLLIDEFQDTDSKQYALAQELLQAHANRSGALFIVGDAKQSIYGWRGAEVEVFQRARIDTGRDPEYLDINFRSVPPILDFCNDFFRRTQLLQAVESPYRGLQAKRNALPGPRIEFLLAETEKGAPVQQGRRNEADLLARRILGWCSEGGILVGDDARLARFGDVALIMRTRSDLPLYEQALRKYGIDYRVESGPGFYARQEVIDIRNLIAVVIDPWDEAALLAYLRSPMIGMTDDAIYALARKDGLAQAFNSSDGVEGNCSAELDRARTLATALREKRGAPLAIFVRELIEQSGVESIYLGQSFLSRQRASNVRKVIALAESFATTSDPSLTRFARYLDDVSFHEMREGEAAMPEDDGGAVRMLTVHQAKGLEFPIVALIDSARGRRNNQRKSPLYLRDDIGIVLRPSDEAGEKQSGIIDQAISAAEEKAREEEDARILYVAMTRARDYLAISGAMAKSIPTDSWLHSFLSTYELEGVGHGEVIGGDRSFDILVTRDAPTGQAPSAPEPEIVWPDTETLQQQIAPVAYLRSGAPRLSVTGMAKRIAALRGEDVQYPATGPSIDASARKAMARGTMVHELLEAWRPDCDEDARIAAIVEAHIDLSAERERAAEKLKAMLDSLRDHPMMTRILEDPETERETPFILATPNGTIEGTVDVSLSDGTIVDYKTGSLKGTPAPEYIAQVQIYAYARRELAGVAPTSGHLFYVDSLDTVAVDIADPTLDTLTDEIAAALQTEAK